MPRALWLILLGLAWLAGTAAAQQAPRCVVALEDQALADRAGLELARAAPFSVWSLAGQEGEVFWVGLPDGRAGCLFAAVLLPGTPELHAERLGRLAAAPLERETAWRLAAGRLEEGDSQWLAELAWGRPARSFMVNRFQDEEHYLYGRPGQAPLLLRFKGGRLLGPVPAGGNPAWLETPQPPR